MVGTFVSTIILSLHQQGGGFTECQKSLKPSKQENPYRDRHLDGPFKETYTAKDLFKAKNTGFARCFDLLRKPKDYRTYVRRRLWFACLWAFIDLCQPVFDRLNRGRILPSPVICSDIADGRAMLAPTGRTIGQKIRCSQREILVQMKL